MQLRGNRHEYRIKQGARQWSSRHPRAWRARAIRPEGSATLPAQRREILDYAQSHRVCEAAREVRGHRGHHLRVAPCDETPCQRGSARRVPMAVNRRWARSRMPSEARDRKVLAMWRQHPGYGPSQIRNQLRRAGFKVSVGTVRHVMESHGYLPPKLKRKEHVGRYEAARPRELYHLDFYHFHVHKQKQCVLFIEDDFSRYIAGLDDGERGGAPHRCSSASSSACSATGAPRGRCRTAALPSTAGRGCRSSKRCSRTTRSTSIWPRRPRSTARSRRSTRASRRSACTCTSSWT